MDCLKNILEHKHCLNTLLYVWIRELRIDSGVRFVGTRVVTYGPYLFISIILHS